MNNEYHILCGDALAKLRTLPDESVQCCITSPPYYGLRDYGTAKWEGGDPDCPHVDRSAIGGQGEASQKQHTNGGTQLRQWAGTCRDCGATREDGQIGLESTPQSYVARLVEVFREVRRVLKKDGTAWVNLGDSYNNRTKVRTSSHQPALNGYVDDNWAERAAKGGVRMSHGLDGIKEKDLIGIPWRVAFALQADGWWLRQDIIWHKPNPMPESVTDRCTKSHEYIFLLTKAERYFFDNEAIAEPIKEVSLQRLGRGLSESHKNINGAPGQTPHSMNKPRLNVKFGGVNLCPDTRLQSQPTKETANRKSVWSVATAPFKDAHFATFPEKLIEPMVLAGSREGDVVLDPFNGAGTTGLVSLKHRRRYIGIELNPEYIEISNRRLSSVQVKLFT